MTAQLTGELSVMESVGSLCKPRKAPEPCAEKPGGCPRSQGSKVSSSTWPKTCLPRGRRCTVQKAYLPRVSSWNHFERLSSLLIKPTPRMATVQGAELVEVRLDYRTTQMS